MESNVFSITVTYNPDIALLNRQIDSLCNQVSNIVIVDNGSLNAAGLKLYLESKSIEIEKSFILIFNKKNAGLGYAQNQGLKAALNKEATDMLILDHDSVIDDGFVKNLLESRRELIDNNIPVGAIGPIYYNENTMEVYPITKFLGPFIKRLTPSKQPVEASFLIASGCLINASVLADVGLMNEDLFIDCIDVDWSFRAASKGYKLFASPNAKMMHTIGDDRRNIIGRNISVHSPLRRYYLYRNSVFMVKSNTIPMGYKIREITFNLLRLLVFFTISKERTKYLKYSLYGFFDGLKGIGGECQHRF
ncbi:MAG: rhamnosyltransferase [Ferruginibacter sp.]|nr:rhamnosyltransferase [Ferruginibacter sp.]